MKEHRTNNFIVVCIILALIVLIPLTGVVADAAINANGNAEIGNSSETDVVIDSNVGSDLNQGANGNDGASDSNGGDNNGNDSNTDGGKVQYFFGKALSLENGLEMVFYVNAGALSDKESVSMEFKKPVYENGTGKFIREDVIVVSEYKATKIAGEDAYRFVFDDINANEYSIDVTATLIADGEAIETITYSVKQYAEAQLSRNLANAKFNTLIVDLLNYGAAAQIYFDYNTDNLANAGLTEAQKAYATQDLPTAVSNKNKVDGEDGLVIIKGVSLSLVNTIVAYVRFDLTCEAEDVYAIIEYTDMDGNAQSKVVDESEFVRFEGIENKYAVSFAEFGPMQMRDTFTVKFFDANTDAQIGDSMTYSIESYVAIALEKQIDANLVNILEMMMKYGASAEAYFGQYKHTPFVARKKILAIWGVFI